MFSLILENQVHIEKLDLCFNVVADNKIIFYFKAYLILKIVGFNVSV